MVTQTNPGYNGLKIRNMIKEINLKGRRGQQAYVSGWLIQKTPGCEGLNFGKMMNEIRINISFEEREREREQC